jgi:hypothetical protein
MKKILDKILRVVDRTVSGTIGKQLLFFLFIAVAVFILLLMVSILLFPAQSPEQTFDFKFWTILFNLIDPGGYENINGFERWLIFITNLCGMVLFVGVLVALLTNTIYQRIDRVKNGEVYYDFSGHVVVIGFDNICKGLVKQLAEQNEVVLQTSTSVEKVRQELLSGLSEKIKKRITIVSGSRVSREDVRKLNINKCKQVFLLGETNEDAHDSQNIECMEIVGEIAAETGGKIRCHVLFNHHSTFAAFEQQDIPGIHETIDFVPFNFYDIWAQKIFVENSYNNGEVSYKPLDHEPITEDSPNRVHLVILGMSNMGIALGLQAAHICHFPNFITKGIKTRITFIDENADRRMNSLKGRLHSFFDEVDYSYKSFNENIRYSNVAEKKKFTDIELEFIKARFEDDAVRRYIEEAAQEKTSFLTVAVALSDASAALASALYLPPLVYDSDVSVLVRQEHSHAIVSMLSREGKGDLYRKYKNLRPFGMVENSYDLKQTDDLLSMMIKYTYDKTKDERTIRDFPEDEIHENWIEVGDKDENESSSKSDDEILGWRGAKNISALKSSNRYCANAIRVKQRSLNIMEGVDLNLRQISLAARMEHNRWVIEKLLVGFRAPTPAEAASITKENRNAFKAHFIHEDIKAYQELGEDEKDINVKAYDINISKSLPYMIKAYREKTEFNK